MTTNKFSVRNLTFLSLVAVLVAAGIWAWNRYGREAIEIPQPESFAKIDREIVDAIQTLIKDCRSRNRYDDQYLTLAKTYHANGLNRLATNTYSIYLRHRPKKVQAWYLNSLCLERLGDLSSACESMQRCVDLDTSYAPAYWRLAMWKSEAGEFDDALKLLDRADALDSRDTQIKLARAKTLLGKNESGRALEILTVTDFGGTPNESYARYLTGTALRREGSFTKAALYLNEPNVTPQWYDEWTSEVNNFAVGIPWKRLQATYLYRSGNFERALALLNEIVRSPQADFSDWNSLGSIHLANGNLKQAIDCFETAIKNQPADYWLYMNLAKAQYAAGPQLGIAVVERSLITLDQAIKLRPEKWEPYEAKAQSLQVLKRNELALEAYDQASERRPEIGASDWRRIYLLLEMKEWDRAEKHLDELATNCSTEPNFLIAEATIDIAKGRVVSARNALQQVDQAALQDPFLQRRFGELKAKLQ